MADETKNDEQNSELRAVDEDATEEEAQEGVQVRQPGGDDDPLDQNGYIGTDPIYQNAASVQNEPFEGSEDSDDSDDSKESDDREPKQAAPKPAAPKPTSSKGDDGKTAKK
jgi:hypothetical protein